jgi:diguanylate cyclase (GGDEF)-like protein
LLGKGEDFGEWHGFSVEIPLGILALGTEEKLDLLGGDEFVIVFVAPATHREQTLSRMKKALRTSFKQLGNDKQKAKVGAAFGISVYPYPSTSITKLLRHADEAMYEVKGIDTPLAVREYTP